MSKTTNNTRMFRPKKKKQHSTVEDVDHHSPLVRAANMPIIATIRLYWISDHTCGWQGQCSVGLLCTN